MPPTIPEIGDSVELWKLFGEGLPRYIQEIAVSLLPIILFFLAAQVIVLRLDRRQLLRSVIGLV